jgi:hypothetical protein
MLSIPIVYPRLDLVDSALQAVATTKKALNGTWNVMTKSRPFATTEI